MNWMRFTLVLVCLAGAATAGSGSPPDPRPRAVPGPVALPGPGSGVAGGVSAFVGEPDSREAASLARAHPDTEPLLAVIALFRAFEHGDVEGYVGVMSDDYRFDSDDPAFRTMHARVYGREDERAFMTHLFRGGGHAPDGAALPTAVSVTDEQGPLWIEARGVDATHAIAHVRRYGPVLVLSDSGTLALGASDNVMQLRFEGGRWRISDWQEHVGVPAAGDSARLAGTPRAGAGDPASAVGLDAIPALSLRPIAGSTGGEMAFALAAPVAGGTLELFDLQGRRLAIRGLGDLPAGTRRVTLPAALLASGVYWARVVQAGQVASTRVVWLR